MKQYVVVQKERSPHPLPWGIERRNLVTEKYEDAGARYATRKEAQEKCDELNKEAEEAGKE